MRDRDKRPPMVGVRQRKAAKRLRRVGLTAGILPMLAACSGPQSMLDSAGTGATEVMKIWWLMFWLGTAIFIGVLILLWFSMFRKPEARGSARRATADTRFRMVVLGGIVLPVVVIAIVFAFSTRGLLAIGNLRGDETVTVDVIGHQYWWEVNYPDEGVVTANEIHVPVDTDVELRLTSSDVIHSLWIPSLHGKMDMMPGHTTTMSIRAEEPGTYRGQCAQFCGVQHANMAFVVIVHPQDSYTSWLEGQLRPAETLSDDSAIARGEQVFLSASCVYCHTVSGTAANGTLGPDLTHFGSRETIAAGTAENNRGNLAGWIVDPQGMKPGNLMPATILTGEELDALLDYLLSLD